MGAALNCYRSHCLRSGFFSGLYLGRRIASHAESLRDRSIRPEGNLDHCAGGLLSARAKHVLDAAQVRRAKSVSVSSPKRSFARHLGGPALAHSTITQSPRSMAWCCTLGFASGNGAVRRLDNRVKEHPVLPLLSLIDPMLLKMAESTTRSGRLSVQSRAIVRRPLNGSIRLIAGVLWLGDTKQALCGNVALRACALHLVDARRDSLARPTHSYAICSDLSAR